MEIVGNIIVTAGAVLMLFSIVGLFRFKDFFSRILVTGIIDTVGAITVIIGLIVKHGFGFFSLKLVLIIALMLILNPLAAHIIARCAYLSDSDLRDEYDDGLGGL